MPILGSLPALKPELELKFASSGTALSASHEVSGVVTLTPEQLLENGVPAALPEGSLVLITDTISFRLRGRITTVLDLLLEQMSRNASAALAVHAAPGTPQPFPQTVVDEAARRGIPLLVTSASAEKWEGVHEEIQRGRLRDAERRATQLSALVQELPAQLADPRAMQRIVDWLARVLDVQALVSDSDRCLAAAPDTAAERLAGAIIRQSVDKTSSGPHTQLIELAPGSSADTVLAVARRTPFDKADLRLLRYAAKLLGLVDQATREYRAASDAARAARCAAFDLLMEGEVGKARRVMANLAPGLLDVDSARIFVIEAAAGCEDAAFQRCNEDLGSRTLISYDQGNSRRILIVHPIHDGHDTGKIVWDQLKRIVTRLGKNSSLGGSGIYSITLLDRAMREAVTVQKFAALQPNSVVLSVHDAELVTLLPQPVSQQWARDLLAPLMCDPAQWESMRETLPTALAFPYTVAARRLQLHRNTVNRRVSRAARLLRLDFSIITDRVAVAMALELVNHCDSGPHGVSTCEPPQLTALLTSPPVRVWAEQLLKSAAEDRRDLLTTARAWLTFDTHVEPTARHLGVSEVTVRSHLRALEKYIQRDLSTLAGVRDLMVSLHAANESKYPFFTSCEQTASLCIVA
ncbi:helix-turn-helix domain-containing protein [Streptomyces sp. NPDC004549]|uniref:helix-turn-helix domain-containing protein n=1 Tax=Streptomyces sp. NPDC004549 TaxID=3154283 RepID=UPI0033B254EF